MTLQPGETLDIGRDRSCDLVLEDRLVSRVQAVLYYGDAWYVADRESGNGTFLNGERIEIAQLPEAGLLSFGDEHGPSLRFAHEGQASAADWNRHPAAGEPGVPSVPVSVWVGGVEHQFETGSTVLLGSGEHCDVRLAGDGVLFEHALLRDDGGWSVNAIGSSWPVRPDGASADVSLIGDGCQLWFGDQAGGQWVEFAPSFSTHTDSTTARPIAGEAPSIPETDFEATSLAGAFPQAYRGHQQHLVDQGDVAHSFIIGSASDCGYPLADILVSRQHARVTERGDSFEIVDLDSLNGTFINGELITRRRLYEGDLLTIGHNDFVRVGNALVRLREASPESGGLEVHGLNFVLPDGKRLLDNVSLTARRGTLTAVVGPSGAGKSTFGRMITGGSVPTGGIVKFDGFDVHRSYSIVRSRIGLVPQEDVLHWQLGLKRALGYAATLRLAATAARAERQAKVRQVIAQLGLDGHEHTRISKLSGGQRKRSSVALELLTEPSLLVLDEPTSGLDPALDRQVMLTLRELADGDRAVVVVTHSVAYLSLCDQILVLAPGGKPVYVGPVEELAAFFGTDDWAEIFAQIAAYPEESHARYELSAPPAPAVSHDVTPHATTQKASRGGASALTQFVTLAIRQAHLLIADRGYLAFLLALPVVLGLLSLVVPGEAGFTETDPTKLDTMGEPSQILSLLMIGACFMGASVSIRELVAERPIFLRERAVGLSVWAYVMAKIVVLGAMTWFSAAVTVAIVLWGKTPPEDWVVIPDARIELYIAVGMTAFVSMLVGLCISAFVRSSDQTMPVLIVMLMAQLVLHGGIIPVTGRAGLDQLSWLMPARWGFAAGASGMGLRDLVPSIDEDWLWEHEAFQWILAIGVLLVMSALLIVVIYGQLRGKKKLL
ncbi:ABC-type multidrug transport system ATPase subunit [Lysinibacter cavernae]|uniref:ABC-type multidrug transport system ATPase subunit n=1 Tax=Lysinibacter cavernae TaxID=1640652 RepID=A0A7X5R0T0_9MICO|nr:ABC-type multidrug transport system ATPase subunit [Lysinibacter cavernae]